MFAHFLHSLPRENRPNCYDSQRKMTTDDFRILIAATEKTGNTWLKLLLSQIYDLPTPYIGQDFSDTLVSLYPYCCNYADHYKEDAAITRALAADASQRQATADLAHHVVDGELIRTFQERITCDLNISISWIRSGRSTLVRYEDLRTEPSTTLRNLAASIIPVSSDRIEQAIEACDIKVLRDSSPVDSRFFRRALIGEWRTVLPVEVLRRFAEEEPFRSQLAFLGYEIEFDETVPTSVL
jgi:hypothetical protein